MADYWKSQPRKFCQYCKCWIADNKPSVEFHERGKNHKENVSLKIAEIKKKSQDKAKQDEKMSKEFATMEEAAMKAYKEDLKRMQLEAGEPVTEDEPEVPPQPSPPPPTQEKPPTREKPHRKASKGKAGKPEKAGKVPKPNLWLEGKSDDGHVYYYHSKTGESSWEKPEGFQERQESHLGQKEGSSVGAWMEAVSPEGYTYYFNSETGESSWERPAHLPPPDEPTAPGTEPTPEREGPPGGPDAAAVAAPTGAPDEAAPPPVAAEDPRVSVEASHKRKAEPLRNEGEAERGEEEEEKKEVQQEEEAALPPKETQEAKEEREAKEEQERRRAKRPKKTTPYGTWEQIQPEEDPYAKVDLQLPQVEEVDEGPEELSLPPEAKPKFRERTITSLGADMGGGGPTSFRKSKTHNGKARSLRQRGEDD